MLRYLKRRPFMLDRRLKRIDINLNHIEWSLFLRRNKLRIQLTRLGTKYMDHLVVRVNYMRFMRMRMNMNHLVL